MPHGRRSPPPTTACSRNLRRLPHRTCWIDTLTEDTLLCILDELPYASRFYFCSTAKRFANLLSRTNWQLVEFNGCEDSGGITEEQLRLFLRRISAKENVRRLRLRNCPRIDCSSCLASLNHSRVLEEIDLRTHGRSAERLTLDFNGVWSTLRTMLPLRGLDPYRLETIHLTRQTTLSTLEGGTDYASWDKPWRQVMERLDAVKSRRAEAARVRCDTCLIVMGDAANAPDKTLAHWALSRSPCKGCGERSCGGLLVNPSSADWCVDCPSFHDCGDCGYTFCTDCSPIGGRCDDCKGAYCEGCRPVEACDVCGDSFCDSCRFVAFCGLCGTTCCDSCHGTVELCDACDDFFCSECRELTRCQTCHAFLCVECDDMASCAGCGEPTCRSCACSHPGGGAIYCSPCYDDYENGLSSDVDAEW